jgi:hypothetical protein
VEGPCVARHPKQLLVRAAHAHRLTPDSALARADAMLEQAASLIERSPHLVDRYGLRGAWPAIYLPLSLLLGKVRYRYTGLVAPQQDWKRVEPHHSRTPTSGDGDHVIPLVVIIRHVILAPSQFASPVELEPFLRHHLVMAHIPRNLDRQLRRDFMPPQSHGTEWHRPIDAGWMATQKRNAVWGRYAEVGVRLPWEDGCEWEEVSSPRLGD